MCTAFKLAAFLDTELRNLRTWLYLTGTLSITKLENAVNPGEANLKDKELVQKWNTNGALEMSIER